MSSSSAITRPEDPNYLFEIHRQTMQLCDAFSIFQYQTERQFDAVFTEFRKMNERFEDIETRVLSLERNVELIKGDQLRISNDVHDIKKTLDKVLEKLS